MPDPQTSRAVNECVSRLMEAGCRVIVFPEEQRISVYVPVGVELEDPEEETLEAGYTADPRARN